MGIAVGDQCAGKTKRFRSTSRCQLSQLRRRDEEAVTEADDCQLSTVRQSGQQLMQGAASDNASGRAVRSGVVHAERSVQKHDHTSTTGKVVLLIVEVMLLVVKITILRLHRQHWRQRRE